MHASSLENMQWCRDKYVAKDRLEREQPVEVLDVGGADCNGSYGRVFPAPYFHYVSADIDGEAGVDLRMESPDTIPAPDRSFDIVISGQMLEHAEFFWRVFEEMARVLADDGLIFLIAPSAGPIHRFPVDCYRFYPDAYRALAKLTGLTLIDIVHDDRGPWNDLVGIFSRTPAPPNATIPEVLLDIQGEPAEPGPEQAEAMRGRITYLDFLASLHNALQPRRYVEIGVRAGRSLQLAPAAAVGIDPAPADNLKLASNHEVFATTSIDFFRAYADGHPIFPFELAFIDGMHRFENVLADFIELEMRATRDAIIVIDDIYPNHPRQAERQRTTRCWTGDVWKMLPCLREYRPDLVLVPFDTHPTGSLLVVSLNPENRVLARQFNPIVRRFGWNLDAAPPRDILERTGGYPVFDAQRLGSLFGDLRGLTRVNPKDRQKAAQQILNRYT